MATRTSTDDATIDDATAGDPAPTNTVDRPWSRYAPIVVVAIAAVVAVVVIARAAHGLTFFWDDEWTMIAHRRDASLDDFLRPNGGHLMVIPVLVYNVLFRTVGIGSYAPYLGVLVGLHVVTCGLLFVYLRRRGSVLYAVVAAVVLLFLGSAWQDLLWAFQMMYMMSLSAGLAALLLLERRDRLGDVLAAVALTLSVASSGVGLVFAGGVVVELAWSAHSRRRLWVPSVPIVLWLVWHFSYGTPRGTAGNLADAPGYVLDVAGSALRAIAGGSLAVGTVVAVALTVVVAVTVVRAWPITPRFACAAAMPYGLWLLLAFGRDTRVPPTVSRYVYLGACFVLVLGGELLAAWQPVALPRPLAIVGSLVLVVVVGHSLVVNVDALHDGARGLRDTAQFYELSWSVLMRDRGHIDPDRDVGYLPESHLRAGEVRAGIRALDFPVLSEQELRRLPPDRLEVADLVLAVMLGLRDEHAASAVPRGSLAVDRISGGTADPEGTCSRITPTDRDARVVLRGDEVAVHVTPVTDAVELRARARAADFSDSPFETIRHDRTIGLRPSGLGPWEVELRSAGPMVLCPAR